MPDDGRLPPAWGPAGANPFATPGSPDHRLADLFTEPLGPPSPAPPDPARLAAEHQSAQQAYLDQKAYDARQAYAAQQERDSGYEPARLGGAHRARRQPARYVLPAIIGALAVVALVIGISGWFRDSDAVATPTPTHSQVSVSTPPTSTTSTGPTPSQTPTPSVTPTPTKSAVAPPPVVPPPVVHAPSVVLNETATRGLAAQVASRLRAKGWTITGTGNWRGNVGTTTVYYPAGMEAAARRMAYDLGVTRIRPRVAGMLTNRLTVVLTSNPFG